MLGRGQHIHVVISEETEQLIRTKLGLSPAEIVTVHHVIAYGLAKKIDRQATDNYRAFQHKVDGILQKAFFNLLLRIGPEEIPEALKACEALFISEKPSAPFDEYGEILVPVPTRHKLEEVGKKMLESRAYAYLIEKGVLNPIEANRELTALLAMENVLPCTVVDTSSDQQTLVQVQTQTQTQTQTKVVSSVGNIPFSWFERPISIPNFVERGTFDNVFDKTVKFAPFCDYARIIGLRDIFLSTEQTKRFACVIPENVGSSENLHPISEKTFSLFSVYSKPIELALYMSDAKGTFMVALDQHDASAICAEGFFSRDIKKGKVLAIVNIRSGTVHPIDGDAVPPLLHEEFSFLVNRVCLKIFAGDLALTRKERIALLARCSQLGENGFEIMSQYIQEYVCAVHPQAQIAKNGILSLLADKGHTFIRTTISSLIDCAMEDSVLRRQIEVLKAEFEEDPSIANDVMFFERLLACDGQKIIDPVEQARKIYLSKISQLESDADAVLSELKTTFFDPENKVLHLKNFIEVMRTGKKTKIAQKAFEEIEGRLIDLEKRLDCAQEILTINVEAEKVLLSWANGLEGDSLNFKVRFPAPYNREQILPCIAAEVQDCITMFIALKKFQKARNKCWGFGQGIWKNQSGQWIVGWTWKTPQHTAIVNSLNLMTVRLKSIIPKISQQKQRQMEELVSLLSESYHTSAVAQSVYDFSTVLSRS